MEQREIYEGACRQAVAAWKEQDWALAAAHLRILIDIRPDLPGYYLNLAYALVRLDRGSEAVEVMKDCAICHHTDADVHYKLAELLMQEGRKEEAVRAYMRFVELTPDDAEALYRTAFKFRPTNAPGPPNSVWLWYQ